MMQNKRLIYANELMDAVDESKYQNPHNDPILRGMHKREHDHFIAMIMQAPSVDAVEVVHGRWIPCENGGYNCANCDRRVAFLVHNRYCPNCGAKMDGGVSSD